MADTVLMIPGDCRGFDRSHSGSSLLSHATAKEKESGRVEGEQRWECEAY
jgi:hypothetical protein